MVNALREWNPFNIFGPDSPSEPVETPVEGTPDETEVQTSPRPRPNPRRAGDTRARMRHDISAQLRRSQLDQALLSNQGGVDLFRDWSSASRPQIKAMQRQVGVADDGILGPNTRTALHRAQKEADPRRYYLERDFSGASRDEVRELQTYLNGQGHDLTVDGVYGENTRGAIGTERTKPAEPVETEAEPEAATETENEDGLAWGKAESEPAEVARPAIDFERDWSTAPRDEVRGLQNELIARGHDIRNDSAWGPSTRAALDAERDGAPRTPPVAPGGDFDPETASRQEIRAAQNYLIAKGHDIQNDGVWGPNTAQAFETERPAGDSPAVTPADATGDGETPEVRRAGDALVVVYPDYDITLPSWARDSLGAVGLEMEKLALGHADVVTWSDEAGGRVRPTLHQYGRYKDDKGQVQTKELDILLDVDPETRDLTPESRERLFAYLSENHGHGGRIQAAEVENVDLDRLNRFVNERRELNRDPNRRAYSVLDNNCTTFAWEAAHAGSVDQAERRVLDGRGAYDLPGWSMNGVGDVLERYDWSPDEGLQRR